MPWVELLLMFIALTGAWSSDSRPVQHRTPPPAASEKVDFAKDVRPIFEARCQPCHFPGGKMYARLPFDQPATIEKLGEKVFSRIRDEPSREIIRRFLAAAR